MTLPIVILAALGILAALLLLLARIIGPAAEASPASPQPRDPVADEVGRWMHEWDRGRA